MDNVIHPLISVVNNVNLIKILVRTIVVFASYTRARVVSALRDSDLRGIGMSVELDRVLSLLKCARDTLTAPCEFFQRYNYNWNCTISIVDSERLCFFLFSRTKKRKKRIVTLTW
jgi:hypothetical protein